MANRPETELVHREAGLQHQLSPMKVAMIALGSTIGTGLFLTSAISVKLAGPGVILSFALGALITLTVMWALAEMAVEHPAAGSFGLYAEMYLGPWAGFVARYTYWLCLVIIIGSEVAATGIYWSFWFPNIPSWIWITVSSLMLIYLNTLNVKDFGTIEFVFAMIKVLTIAAFLLLGTGLVLGIGFPKIGTGNFTGHGGFFPNGWRGVGLGVITAIFSFLGLEIVGVTAGEAADPRKAVPSALKRTLSFLALFYLGGLVLVVGIVPWAQIGTDKSPFVTVFEKVGIPAASHMMNFVVLTAALSSALCNLYFTARMLFSLSRGGYAPNALGRLNKRGMPAAAVIASSLGMAAALLLNLKFSNSAFFFLIGVAFFGGPFIWIMILVTHMAFRKKMQHEKKEFVRFAPRGLWSSAIGLLALLGVLASTWWVPDFHVSLLAGPPWLAFLTLCYFIWRAYQNRKSGGGTEKA